MSTATRVSARSTIGRNLFTSARNVGSSIGFLRKWSGAGAPRLVLHLHRGEDDDGDPRRDGVGLQDSAGLDAVHLRHLDVEDDRGRASRRGPRGSPRGRSRRSGAGTRRARGTWPPGRGSSSCRRRAGSCASNRYALASGSLPSGSPGEAEARGERPARERDARHLLVADVAEVVAFDVDLEDVPLEEVAAEAPVEEEDPFRRTTGGRSTRGARAPSTRNGRRASARRSHLTRSGSRT